MIHSGQSSGKFWILLLSLLFSPSVGDLRQAVEECLFAALVIQIDPAEQMLKEEYSHAKNFWNNKFFHWQAVVSDYWVATVNIL